MTTDHLGRTYSDARCPVCVSLGRPDGACERLHGPHLRTVPVTHGTCQTFAIVDDQGFEHGYRRDPFCTVCDPYGSGVECKDHPAPFLPRVECSQAECNGSACYAIRADIHLCHACAVHRYGAEAIAYALA